MSGQTGSVRRTALAGVAVIAAAALIGAACGGKSSADKTATAAAASGASSRATATTAGGASRYGTPAAAATSAATAGAATSGAATVKITPVPAGATLKDEQGNALTQYLTDAKGITLYEYKPDVPNSGKSSVPASIAAIWPPLTVTGAPVKPDGLTGDLGTITLPDGSKQVTYKGKPLYHFKNDAAPGDTNGEGLAGIWHVVGP